VPTIIETQFPIARLSAESYKERKANNGQTLVRLPSADGINSLSEKYEK
jgi:hypothetical protein